MDYNKIIIDGYIEVKKNNKSYVSYFKREAKKNKAENYEEFTDFFNGCKSAIGRFGHVIQRQHDDYVLECDNIISLYKQGRVQNSNRVMITDPVEIAEAISRYEEQKREEKR